MALDILHLRQEDWRAEFGDGDLLRGQAYAAQGRSRLLSLKDSTLLASCRGSGAQTYQQRITLHHYGQGWGVTGHCSCPVGFNCKHVASALLTLQTQQEQGVDLSPLIISSTQAREECLENLQPSPVLSLGSLVRVHFDARKGRMQEQTQHRAALAFNYQGHLASGKQGKDLLIKQSAQHSLRIVRDISAETQLRKRLEQTGLQVALRQSEALPESAGEAYEQPSETAWLQFIREHLPALRAEGWQIRMQPDFQFNLAQVDDWYAEVEEDPEQTWFDLELGIEVEGQRISLLPILLQAIRQKPWLLNGEALNKRDDDEVVLVSLPHNHKRAALPLARLKPLLATLGELFVREPSESNQRLRLSRLDAARLGEPRARLSIPRYMRLGHSAIQLCGDAARGLEMGRHSRIGQAGLDQARRRRQRLRAGRTRGGHGHAGPAQPSGGGEKAAQRMRRVDFRPRQVGRKAAVAAEPFVGLFGRADAGGRSAFGRQGPGIRPAGQLPALGRAHAARARPRRRVRADAAGDPVRLVALGHDAASAP